MFFRYLTHTSPLLAFVGPGAAAVGWLLARALRRLALTDALLALLLLVLTSSLAYQMLNYSGWASQADWHRTLLHYLPWNLSLLLGPGYYLYFRALTNQDFQFGWREWRHLLPGMAHLSLALGVAAVDFLLWPDWQRAAPASSWGPGAAWLAACSGWLNYVGYMLLLGYGLRLLRDYRSYRQYLRDNFSDTERLRFAGLRQLLVLHASALGLSLAFTLMAVLGHDSAWGAEVAWHFSVVRGAMLYVMLAVGIEANYAAAASPLRFEEMSVSQPGLPDLPPTASPVTTATTPTLDPQPSLLAPTLSTPATLDPELVTWKERLLWCMGEERPWLEPELSLAELAQRLQLHPAVLSKVINSGCGQNFSDFVNGYRAAEARRKLTDPRLSHYTLMGIALESGFNSKSTFNRVFKKFYGHVPSEVARPSS